MKINSMKTIEEAANECANTYVKGYRDSYPANEGDFIDVFEAGVEFAQRWIPVEEELPEVGRIVLVKTKINKVTTCEMYIPKDYLGNILGEKEWAASYNFKQAITHWRPIDLK